MTARRKNGEIFPIELSVGDLDVVRKEQFVGIIRDISDRQRALAALKQNEEMFRDFTESLSDWFWETDGTDVITRVGGSPATLECFAVNNCVGRNRLDVMARDAPPALIEEHRHDFALAPAVPGPDLPRPSSRRIATHAEHQRQADIRSRRRLQRLSRHGERRHRDDDDACSGCARSRTIS